MTDSSDTRKSNPPNDSASSSEPGVMSDTDASAERTGQTVMQETLSETGEEASDLRPQALAVGVGTKLGPYQLVRKLGQGGMGAVYEAQHTKLDKRFALKVLPPGFASNAAALSRFEREMKAVGKLDHPHIIKATNADEWNGTHYLVMEYIEGTDLSLLVKERGVLSVRDACKVIRQAALGLQHAHEHDLVHRDIKPSNLFLTKSGQVKLLDLGLARLGGDDQENAGLTSSGQMLGTPDYMAPEQWDDTHTADARADLYSLGCTLGYLLTGKAPFDNGQKRSFLQIMKFHSESAPPNLTQLRNSVPAELNTLFQRLLAKKPVDRFQTAAEVVSALEAFTRKPDSRASGSSAAQQDDPASDHPHDETPSASGERASVERAGVISDQAGEVDSLAGTNSIREWPSDIAPAASIDLPTTSILKPQSLSSLTRITRPRMILLLSLFAGLILSCGIIIKIKFPEGSEVEITNDGNLKNRSKNRKASASTSTSKLMKTNREPVILGKPLTPLPPLDLDETDPLPGWELPAGAPPPVVAPCEPTLAKERQQLWAEFLKRPVIEELDVAKIARSAPREGEAPAEPRGGNKNDPPKDGSAGASPSQASPQNATTLKFALIPPGEFRKVFTRPRDPAIEPDMPVRRFRITKPYAMSTTEVTWDQFRQFVEATGYQTEAETNGLGGRDREFKPDPKINWRTPGWKPAPNEPVTQVTPRDAEAFCAWLTDPANGGRQAPGSSRANDLKANDPKTADRKTTSGLTPTVRLVYRLPTEAEWLHACRAGSVHKHVVGPKPSDLADYAWTKEFLDPNPQASPLHLVAQKKPNPFGLHDTLGNVWEMTADAISAALLPTLPTENPIGGRIESLVGFATNYPAADVHPEMSHLGYAHQHWYTNGFRVLKQFDGEPLPGPLDRPLVLRAGQPLSVHALVPRPEKIPGLQSWSLELASSHSNNPISAIAASPKGDVIATGSGFGKISLWDRDGNYQRALLGHEVCVNSLDFSPDGRWLASCEEGGGDRGFGGITARIWNVETGALHVVIPIPGWSRRIKFSTNGDQLAVSFGALYQASFVILDLRTGDCRMPSNVVRGGGLAWSPDSSQLACSHEDGHLRAWDVKSLKVVRDVEAPLSSVLEWSPDGQWLAMCHSDGKVSIRDAKTLELTNSFGSAAAGSSHTLAWLPDSKRLVVAGGSDHSVFDVTTGEQVTISVDGNSPSIAVIDEGKQAVIESYGRLHFYDTSTGQKLREGKERGIARNSPTSLVPNGNEVVTSRGRKLSTFDSTNGKRLLDYALSHPFPYDLRQHSSSDGRLIAVSGGSILMITEKESGIQRHELSHGDGEVWRSAWSPDGRWLATGATDKLVRVWNVATGKVEHELSGHTEPIWSLAWSPDGTRLASAAEDKTVRLWDPLAGKLVATYDQFPEAVNFELSEFAQYFSWSRDSRRLWIALTNNIVPLDVETGTFGPLENFSNGNIVSFLNTSPDGQRLLVRANESWTFVRGRDAQDRRLLGQHLGWTAQWHPDSRRFLGWEYAYGTVGFDVETNRRLGLLFPWLTGDHWLCLGPTGHYRGSPGVEDQFVYVALLPDGSQRTYTPAEFAKTFNWKNDPEKAELLGK